MKKLSIVILTAGLSVNAIAEKTIDISAAQIDAIRIHTTQHAASTARKIVTIKMSNLEDGCSSGVFLNSEDNAATLSIALSAFVSKSDIRIAYEPNSPAPWGDTKYCALTYLDIK